jgi:hypothetical protein
MNLEDWLDELAACFAKSADMTLDEAREFVESCEWDDFFEDGLSPEDACREEMSCWTD